VGVSKYPAPNTLRWDRPQYDDDKFVAAAAGGEEDEEGGEEEDEFDEFGPAAPAEDEVSAHPLPRAECSAPEPVFSSALAGVVHAWEAVHRR